IPAEERGGGENYGTSPVAEQKGSSGENFPSLPITESTSIEDSQFSFLNFDTEFEKHKEEGGYAIAYLSKRPANKKEPVTVNVLEVADIIVPLDDMKEKQESCEDTNRLILYLMDGILPTDEKLARKTSFEADQYLMQEGLLYHVSKRKASKLSQIVYPLTEQLVIPSSMRFDLMKNYHQFHHKIHDRCFRTITEKYY